MIDIVYRVTPTARRRALISLIRPRPGDSSRTATASSRRSSIRGRARGDRASCGSTRGSAAGEVPALAPFAAVLGCADARVPTELVFHQGANDLFVVRGAPHGLGSECLGSLTYAFHHFPQSLRLLVVLAHSQRGAVTAAVDAFLTPSAYLDMATDFPLRSIVVINAAWTAFSLREELHGELAGVEVVYGVHDLATRRVGVPLAGRPGPGGGAPALLEPPRDAEAFRELWRAVAGSDRTQALLAGAPAARTRG